MIFMVEGTPKQATSQEMLALIPAEMERGKAFDAQGLRSAIYVAADLSKVWQIFTATSQEEVQRALESLPLYRFTAYTITPLADNPQ